MALAPPPPLQMLAIPMDASFLFSTLIKLITILAPLAPIGWPKATAPPCTLTLLMSKSYSLMLARATAEKASLTSWNWMSLLFMPNFFSRLLQALAGAMAKSIGCTAASS